MKIIDFVPPIMLHLWRQFKDLFPQKYPQSPLTKMDMRGKSVVIVGNGPSLNKTIELYGDEILKHDRICVNYFVLSEYYERFKPQYYVLADPMFFDSNSCQKNTVKKMVDALVEKTEWPMYLCIPFSAKDSEPMQKIHENANIQFLYYDTTQRAFRKLTKFEMWDKNLTRPPMQNVSILSLYLALYWGYSESYIVGVDTSSLEEIRIDQETNEMFSIDTHFYNSADLSADKELYDKSKRKILSTEWTLHEYLYAYALMFEYYYDLSKFAEYKGLKVYNASEYSWINCFDRKKLK